VGTEDGHEPLPAMRTPIHDDSPVSLPQHRNFCFVP
jgi:hypothetical protein